MYKYVYISVYVHMHTYVKGVGASGEVSIRSFHHYDNFDY